MREVRVGGGEVVRSSFQPNIHKVKDPSFGNISAAFRDSFLKPEDYFVDPSDKTLKMYGEQCNLHESFAIHHYTTMW